MICKAAALVFLAALLAAPAHARHLAQVSTLCGSDLLRKQWEQLRFVPPPGPGGRLPSPAAAAGYPAVVGMGISGSRGLLLDSVPR